MTFDLQPSTICLGLTHPQLLFNFLFSLVSLEQGQLVIRDLGNLFLKHQETERWNKVCIQVSPSSTGFLQVPLGSYEVLQVPTGSLGFL